MKIERGQPVVDELDGVIAEVNRLSGIEPVQLLPQAVERLSVRCGDVLAVLP